MALGGARVTVMKGFGSRMFLGRRLIVERDAGRMKRLITGRELADRVQSTPDASLFHCEAMLIGVEGSVGCWARGVQRSAVHDDPLVLGSTGGVRVQRAGRSRV